MNVSHLLTAPRAMACLLLVPLLGGCGNAEKRLSRVLLNTKLECKLNEKCHRDDHYDCADTLFTEGDISQAIDELGLSESEMNACRKAHKAADKCQLKLSCDEYYEERDYCTWGEQMIACCEIEGWLSDEDLCATQSGGRCDEKLSTWIEDCGRLLTRVNSIAHERVHGWRPDLPSDMRATPEASCVVEEEGLGICTSFAGDLSADRSAEEAWCSNKSGTFSSNDACEDGDLGACVLPPLQGDAGGARQVIQHYFSLNESGASSEAVTQAWADCVDWGNFLPPAGVP